VFRILVIIMNIYSDWFIVSRLLVENINTSALNGTTKGKNLYNT
jgi:hypothetical protein